MPVVLVPRRAGLPDRDALWAFVRPWWEEQTGLALIEGHHEHGPFNRSAAINAAAEAAGAWDVAVIIDADVLVGAPQVHAAVACAERTGAMATGFTDRWNIDEAGTARVLAGWQGNWSRHARRVRIESVSSCVAVRRDLWDRAGGFDERFVGWGWEDVAFRLACEAYSARPMARIGGTLWHLHHRPSRENNRDQGTFHANKARGAQYREAMWNPEKVDQLRGRFPGRLPVPA